MTVTKEQLAELKAKAEASMPPECGPWYSGELPIFAQHASRIAFLAAASPAVVLQLLARIEELETQVRHIAGCRFWKSESCNCDGEDITS